MIKNWYNKCFSHIDHYKLSIVVFILFSSWMISFPFQGQVFSSIVNLYDIDVSTIILGSISIHLVGLITAGFFIKNIFIAKKLILFTISYCIFGSITFFFRPSILWSISLVTMSFFAGIFVAAWAFYLKYFTPQNKRMVTVANVLIYSNVIMIGLNSVAINISPYIGLTFSLIVLGIALFFAFGIPVNIDTQIKTVLNDMKKKAVKSLVFLCIFIAVITINSGLMYQVVNPAFEHLQWLSSWYWAIPYIIAIFIMKVFPGRFNRSYALYVAVAMIGFSFILFMILDRSVVSYLLIDTLMLGACGIFDLFWWSTLGEMLELYNNPAKVFGIGLSTNVLGILIGGFIGSKITVASIGNFNPSIIALAVLFIIFILLPLLNKQLSFAIEDNVYLNAPKESSTAKPPQQENQIVDKTKGISQLTVRENEIVELLLKGRTYKMIASELYLSENTIKTHIKNIYSKFNIKCKAELISLLSKKGD